MRAPSLVQTGLQERREPRSPPVHPAPSRIQPDANSPWGGRDNSMWEGSKCRLNKRKQLCPVSSQNPSASTSTGQAIGQPLILAVACVIGSTALHVGSQACGFPPATSPPNLFLQSCWMKSPCCQVLSGHCTPDLTHDVFQPMASRVVPGAGLATSTLGGHPIPPPTC